MGNKTGPNKKRLNIHTRNSAEDPRTVTLLMRKALHQFFLDELVPRLLLKARSRELQQDLRGTLGQSLILKEMTLCNDINDYAVDDNSGLTSSSGNGNAGSYNERDDFFLGNYMERILKSGAAFAMGDNNQENDAEEDGTGSSGNMRHIRDPKLKRMLEK